MEQDTSAGVPVAPVVTNKNKGGNGLKAFAAIASILAICGIGFGVYGMFFNNTNTTSTSDNCATTVSGQENTSSVVQGNLPSVGTITNLLSEKYGLFDDGGVSVPFGNILTDYVYGENGEGLSEAGKLFLVISKEYPSTGCNDVKCTKTISYEDLNNKYHEYFGDSNNIKKGADYTSKHIFIGVESIKNTADGDSFEVVYPNAIGGTYPASRYYTNIVDVERNSNGGITATAIATKFDAEDMKLAGTSSCLDAWECPIVDMKSIDVSSNLYKYNFIEEDGTYKLVDIVKK